MALDPNDQNEPTTDGSQSVDRPQAPQAPGSGPDAADDGTSVEATAAPGAAPGDEATPREEPGASATPGDSAAEGEAVEDGVTDEGALADPDATEEWASEEADHTTEFLTSRDPELEQLRDVSFPVVWRGYDVQQVDAYTTAVERALARFEERTYPTVAVQRALDRVGEQTASILRHAEDAAEETTRRSRAQADDRLQRAEREAADVQAGAIARVRALDDDIERLWQERQRLIDATKELAEHLRTTALDAESRFPAAADSSRELPPTREQLLQDDDLLDP